MSERLTFMGGAKTSDLKQYDPTIVDVFKSLVTIDKQSCNVQVIDTAGQGLSYSYYLWVFASLPPSPKQDWQILREGGLRRRSEACGEASLSVYRDFSEDEHQRADSIFRYCSNAERVQVNEAQFWLGGHRISTERNV